MHIINKNNVYMTLTKNVVNMIDTSKLVNCQVFICTQDYMDKVISMFPGLDEDSVSGSEMTVWDDGLVENSHIEKSIFMDRLEQQLSDLDLS